MNDSALNSANAGLPPYGRTPLRRLFPVLTALALLWGGAVWVMAAHHFDTLKQELITASTREIAHRADTMAAALEWRIRTMRGVATLMAQDEHVRARLKRFGSDVVPSAEGRIANIQRWEQDAELQSINRMLATTAYSLGVDEVWIMNAAGDCVSSSNAGKPDQFIGSNFSAREYFKEARLGQQGQQYAMGKVSNRAGLYFSNPVFVNGRFVGVVAVKRNLDQLSYLMQHDYSLLLDENGVVILSQDKNMEMMALAGAPVYQQSNEQRSFRYQRSEFPQLQLSPLGEYAPNIFRIGSETIPLALESRAIENSEYRILTALPIAALPDYSRQHFVSALSVFLAGLLLLLGGAGFWHHQQTQAYACKRLNQSERSYRGIFNSLDEAIYIHDAQGRILDINEGALKMYGHPRSFFLGQTPEVVAAPGRNDFSAIAAQLQRAYEGTPQSLEFWAIRASGDIFRKVVHLYPGEYFGDKVIIAIATDITERKRLEEASQLAALVYRHTSEALLVCDEQNRIIAVNPAFTAITGYSEAEAVGRDPSLLKSGRQPESFYQDMWHALNTSGSWQGEIWNRRKDGETFAEWLTIDTIYRPDGGVDRRVAQFSDISKRKEVEEIIWRQANFDPLTGLPNRRNFLDRLHQELTRAERERAGVGLLFINLDRFKEINDTLGHEAGDELLRQAAERIRQCVRETDTVARLGGDEFTAILPMEASHHHINRIAQNLIEHLAAPFELLAEHQSYVSASIGITLYPEDGASPEDMLRHADQAMYAAKAEGRNRYHYFTPALQEAALKRLSLANALRHAIADMQLSIVFQPIVRLTDNHIHKAEVLLRWQHPEFGMVSPAEFIPLAEEIGMIDELGDWVFQQATRWIKHWQPLHQDTLQLSINMSPLQLLKRNTAAQWALQLRDMRLCGANLIIEITEGLLMNERAQSHDPLSEYRSLGIQAALDDFGTGYTSLSNLRKFDIDYLKIDRAFVHALGKDGDSTALIDAIIAMAHKLGLMVIAEGVETEAQRDFLIRSHCDYAQGYLFSHPLPPDQFEHYYDGMQPGNPRSGD